MKKKILTVVIGLGLAVTLGACGDQAQETPATTPAATPAAPAAPPAPATPASP
jgi:hypothetical protein